MAASARLLDWADRRDAPRIATRRPARIDGEWFSCTGDLLNISASGAMVATAHPPRKGRNVALVCEDVDAAARIVWVGDRRFGLAFDAQLSTDQLSRLAGTAL